MAGAAANAEALAAVTITSTVTVAAATSSAGQGDVVYVGCFIPSCVSLPGHNNSHVQVL
jgi:hypothetical protein